MERRGRRIYLNENGPFIEIRPWDEEFWLRMVKFQESLGALKQEFRESIASFKKEFDGEADNPSERCIAEGNRRWVYFCRKLGQEINNLFGEDIARMAFPDTECPDWYAWEDFMTELLPLIGEIYEEYDAGNKDVTERKEQKSIRKVHGLLYGRGKSERARRMTQSQRTCWNSNRLLALIFYTKRRLTHGKRT